MSLISQMIQHSPLGQLSKMMSGMEQMMAGASQCLSKLASGNILGAMNEMMKIGKGASKAMEGMTGGAPGMQMDPLQLLKQLMGGGKAEGGGDADGADGADDAGGGGGGGGSKPGSLLDALPKMMQDLMGLQHSMQNMESMMRGAAA